jgi:hypothetical protein
MSGLDFDGRCVARSVTAASVVSGVGVMARVLVDEPALHAGASMHRDARLLRGTRLAIHELERGRLRRGGENGASR